MSQGGRLNDTNQATNPSSNMPKNSKNISLKFPDAPMLSINDYQLIGDQYLCHIAQRAVDSSNLYVGVHPIVNNNLCLEDTDLAKLLKKLEVTTTLLPNVLLGAGIKEVYDATYSAEDIVEKLTQIVKKILSFSNVARLGILLLPPSLTHQLDADFWLKLEKVNKSLRQFTFAEARIFYVDPLSSVCTFNNKDDVRDRSPKAKSSYFNRDGSLRYFLDRRCFQTITQDCKIYDFNLSEYGKDRILHSVLYRINLLSSSPPNQETDTSQPPENSSTIANPGQAETKMESPMTENAAEEIVYEDFISSVKPSLNRLTEIEDDPVEILPKIVHRAYVKATVYNDPQEILILLDSGASRNHISNSLADYFIKKFPQISYLPARAKVYLALFKKSYSVSKIVYLPVTFTDGTHTTEITIEFQALEHLNSSCIFGDEYFRDRKVCLDFNSRTFQWKLEDGNRISIPFASPDEVCQSLNAMTNNFAEMILADANIAKLPELIKLQFTSIVEQNSAIFESRIGCCTCYTHSFIISDKIQPYRNRYPIAHCYEKQLEEMMDMWLDQKIVEKSNSPYENPITIVRKADKKSIRPCGDYRELNVFLATEPERNLTLDEMKVKFANAAVFTKLDLVSSFLQIPLDEKSRQYTAFTYKGTTYHFNRVPYGTCDSNQGLLKALKIVFQGCEACFIFYVDDILIFSRSEEEHIDHLAAVFYRLAKANLTLNFSKCTWFADSVSYLGFVISKDGIRPNEKKVEAIQNYPIPESPKQLLSFLGVMNYFRGQIPNYADISQPLHKLSAVSTNEYAWSEEANQAFITLKQKLAEATLLVFPDFNKPFHLMTDISYKAVAGAVYQLQDDQTPVPIAFVSRVLQPAETRYTVTELELLAVVYSLRKVQYYLLGYLVYIYTDHAAIPGIKPNSWLNHRVNRWLIDINYFKIEYRVIRGNENPVGDALSRFHHNLTSVPDDHIFPLEPLTQVMPDELKYVCSKLSQFQFQDPELSKIIDMCKKSTNSVHLKFCFDEEIQILLHINSANKSLPVLPGCYRDDVIAFFHQYYGHPSAEKTASLLRREFSWPGICKQVAEFVSSCRLCRLSKANTNPSHGEFIAPIYSKPLQCVYIDTYGPLPRSTFGYNYILVLKDGYSKFIKLYAAKSTESAEAVRAVRSFTNAYGKMERIISDRGSQFNSHAWHTFLRENGIAESHCTSYHPQPNQAETVMKQLGVSLRLFLKSKQSNWYSHLKAIESKLNHCVHSSTNLTPWERFYGTKPATVLVQNVHLRFQTQGQPLDPDELQSSHDFEKKLIDSRRKLFANHANTKLPAVNDVVFVKNHKQSNKSDGFVRS